MSKYSKRKTNIAFKGEEKFINADKLTLSTLLRSHAIVEAMNESPKVEAGEDNSTIEVDILGTSETCNNTAISITMVDIANCLVKEFEWEGRGQRTMMAILLKEMFAKLFANYNEDYMDYFMETLGECIEDFKQNRK